MHTVSVALSKRFIRSLATQVQSAPKDGGDFVRYLEYLKTSKDMRPLLYRPRNAAKLLTMDLGGGEIPTPRDPIQLPSVLTYAQLLDQMESAEQLQKHFVELRQVHKKALWEHLSAQHLQHILLRATFGLHCFGPTLTAVYQLKPLFARAKNTTAYDVDHLFNTILTCRLHTNSLLQEIDPVVATKKVAMSWENTNVRQTSTGLSAELLTALSKQVGGEIPVPTELKVPVILPSIDVDACSMGKAAAFVSAHRIRYLQARTATTFGSTNEAVMAFVSCYRAALERTGRVDFYDLCVAALAPKQEP
ncbi:AEL323Wp [Eremothecium gossypii ATCC 10895]|uniref:AEL323Wp n=1 Tax=Eremothecium gossypii (strain ATCC 10895 / CBS 109.51 / FGSC 9923 / NRRL Y-1056) TaxID=284811 RepID=Q758S5_EREGS|nr:AEL323Wp [Eremothecium gossypii ATCC 10895]AAS52361.1 AEL323Wp [Eremothecium gossypii ATCC 10895]AEY96658.1 FAEL323Wp [Eremothecium gossypii FDAG1]